MNNKYSMSIIKNAIKNYITFLYLFYFFNAPFCFAFTELKTQLSKWQIMLFKCSTK